MSPSRTWTWFLRLWDVYEALGCLAIGFASLGIAFVTWRKEVVGPFHGPATERAAHDAHDGMTLIFALLRMLFLIVGLVWGYSLTRDVREENDGRWG